MVYYCMCFQMKYEPIIQTHKAFWSLETVDISIYDNYKCVDMS